MVAGRLKFICYFNVGKRWMISVNFRTFNFVTISLVTWQFSWMLIKGCFQPQRSTRQNSIQNSHPSKVRSLRRKIRGLTPVSLTWLDKNIATGGEKETLTFYYLLLENRYSLFLFKLFKPHFSFSGFVKFNVILDICLLVCQGDKFPVEILNIGYYTNYVRRPLLIWCDSLHVQCVSSFFLFLSKSAKVFIRSSNSKRNPRKRVGH